MLARFARLWNSERLVIRFVTRWAVAVLILWAALLAYIVVAEMFG